MGLAAFLFALWLAVPFPAGAAEPAEPVVLGDRGEYQIWTHLDILEDPDKSLSIDDVASPEAASKFKRHKYAIPNLGLTKSAIWLRFRVKNPDGRSRAMLLSNNYPNMDRISLFTPKPDGGFDRLDAGDSVPQSDGVIPDRSFVFPITVPANTEITGYLRAESTGALTFPISLMTKAAFESHRQWDKMGYGLLFGTALGFAVFFIVISFKLRNRSCLWFSFYILLYGLRVATREGFSQELLGQEYFALNTLQELVHIGLLYFAGAKFLRTFLDTRKYSRWVDNVLFVLQWMGIFFIPINLIDNPLAPLYGLILVGIGPFFSTTVSVVFWIKGVPNAKYFAIGWLVGHFVSTVELLRIFGLLPFLPFMEYLLAAGLVSALIFFSLAIVQQTYMYQVFAWQDPLTGLANRRHFDQVLENEWNRNMRHQRPVSLIMAEVDFFKGYNDTYGHKEGDQCLVEIAGMLRKSARRPGDLAARHGGEEFTVLLPETDGREAAQLAEAIRAGVESLARPHKKTKVAGTKVVTISLGVAAAVPSQGADPQSLVTAADERLYQAKTAGRNKVVSG